MKLDLPVSEHVLSNGLRLLVLPRHDVPQVACRITFCVGSANERPGLTGASHFLEHMMFKGTERIGVTDAARGREILEKLDGVARRIDEIEARLSPAELAAARGYEKDPTGEKPASWDRYRALGDLRERMAALRREEDSTIVAEELWNLYRRAGGTGMNAATGHDWTSYFVKLPAGKEELFFWLESDRMVNAVFRQFYPEKEVILEERHTRVDAAPSGRFEERLNSIFFEAHPYRRSVVGYVEDIERMTREELEGHYRLHYRPNNAIVTIVGDVEPGAARALAERYFGPLSAGPPIPAPRTYDARDVGVKRFEAEAQASDRVIVLFHTPPEGHPDGFALDCAAGCLSGSSGRLYRRLVLSERIAVAASAANWTRKYAGQFMLSGVAAPGADLARIEASLLDEIDRLRRDPPSDEELSRSKLLAEAHFVQALDSLLGAAELVAQAEAIGSWRDLETYLPRLHAVTSETVAAAAKTYLGSVKTIGILRRAARGAETTPQPATPSGTPSR